MKRIDGAAADDVDAQIWKISACFSFSDESNGSIQIVKFNEISIGA
jgi:hypothetical protein